MELINKIICYDDAYDSFFRKERYRMITSREKTKIIECSFNNVVFWYRGEQDEIENLDTKTIIPIYHTFIGYHMLTFGVKKFGYETIKNQNDIYVIKFVNDNWHKFLYKKNLFHFRETGGDLWR